MPDRGWDIKMYFEKLFSLHSASNKQNLKQLKNELIELQLINSSQNKPVTKASYHVSQKIAQTEKPYGEGKMI